MANNGDSYGKPWTRKASPPLPKPDADARAAHLVASDVVLAVRHARRVATARTMFPEAAGRALTALRERERAAGCDGPAPDAAADLEALARALREAEAAEGEGDA